MENNNEKTIATLTHLSVFAKYLIPLSNFIIPIIILATKGKESEYVKHHSKSVLNFQLSVFIYSIILGVIGITTLLVMIFNDINLLESIGSVDDDDIMTLFKINGILALIAITVFVAITMCIIEFILTIYGSVKASNNQLWHYPLTIKFLK